MRLPSAFTTLVVLSLLAMIETIGLLPGTREVKPREASTLSVRGYLTCKNKNNSIAVEHSQSPTLPAKLSPPRVSTVVTRERLFKLLDGENPLIWISAPAGAGKTTLVASYFETQATPPLWYKLDECDSDPAAFFHYLKQAALSLDRECGRLPVLSSEYLTDTQAFGRQFFRQLFSCLPDNTALVFDNYQDAGTETPLHQLLPLAIEETGNTHRLIAISRHDPPASYSRLRANNQLSLIDWPMLQLNEEEGRAIARLHLKVPPEEEQALNELIKRSQGWVAALILLLYETARSGQIEISSRHQDMQRLFDYFAEEIFQHSDPAIRDFLLSTAFLPTITLDAAQQVSHHLDAREVLEDFSRRNYFTQRHEQGSFEYHPLFRAFLMHQAEKHLSAEQLLQLKRHSAEQLLLHGSIEEAVGLLIQISDWQRLQQLILQQAPILIGQGRATTLSGWLQALPQSELEQTPRLAYWRGLCLLTGDPVQARSWLERAYTLAKSSDAHETLYLSWNGIVESYFIEWHDFRPLRGWMREYPALQADHRQLVSEQTLTASLFNYVTAMVYIEPNAPQLADYVQRAETRFVGDVKRWFMQGGQLIYVYLWIGKLAVAERILPVLEAHANSAQASPLERLYWRVIKSLEQAFRGQPDMAESLAREGLHLAQEYGIHSYDYLLASAAITAQLMQNDLHAARETANALLPVPEQYACRAATFLFHAASVSFHEGDLNRAAGEAERSRYYDAKTGLLFGHAMIGFCSAVIRGKTGDTAQALNDIEQIRQTTQSIDSPILRYCYSTAAANIHLWRGETDQALRKFADGLGAVHEDGRLGLLAWQLHPEASQLFNLALKHQLHPATVQQMIVHARLPAPAFDIADDWPFPLKIHTLGRFNVLVNGEPLTFNGKAQKKPLELLKALIAQGGRSVNIAELASLLWPDTEADKAQHVLISTRSRLHKLLGNSRLLLLENGRLSLNSATCWLDIWSFESMIGNEHNAAQREHALALYQGPFLKGDEEAWILPLRERLHSKYLRTLIQQGAKLEEAGHWQRAIDAYLSGLETDPLAEPLYLRLIQCYQVRGRHVEALRAYHRCYDILSSNLGIEPGEKLKQLCQVIRQAEKSTRS